MKKIVTVLLALMLLCGTALAETRITVNGEGIVYIPADTCVISLGVTEINDDALNAQSNVNTKIRSITDALIANGIEETNITTGQLYIYARYDYDNGTEKVIGYSASATISIRTDDVENAGSIIDTAFINGANSLDGISFGAKDTSAAETECLKAAVADAAAKADTLCEALGMTLGTPVEVNEGYSYTSAAGNDVVFAKEMPAEEAAGDSYTPTEVRSAAVCVNATVSIVYTAE